MTDASVEIPPVVTPVTGEDLAAPYGRRSDGTPRAKPGRPPGRTTASTQPRRTTTAAKITDYRTPIIGLIQIPAGILSIAGMRKPVFAADAAAITVHGPNIADALDKLAQERPEVAAVLDRVLQVGPYGVLIAAVAPLVLQILANHDALPSGALGTIPPGELVGQFVPDNVREEVERSFMRDGQGGDRETPRPPG
jgi:hypothetical protein